MTATTALITGATRGIGREVARQLAALGHAVLLGARDLDRGRAWRTTLALLPLLRGSPHGRLLPGSRADPLVSGTDGRP